MENAAVDIQNGSAKDAEVFITPSGGSSIVVLEDRGINGDGGDDDEAPIPARKFAPPPNLRRGDGGGGGNDRRGDNQHRRQLETRDMLPAEDVLQFVDLEELANPEKLAKKVAPTVQSVPPPDDTRENPVPPKFPPAPQRKRKPATGGGGGAEVKTAPRPAVPQPPKRSSPPPAPSKKSAPNVWENKYEAHGDEREVYDLTPAAEEDDSRDRRRRESRSRGDGRGDDRRDRSRNERPRRSHGERDRANEGRPVRYFDDNDDNGGGAASPPPAREERRRRKSKSPAPRVPAQPRLAPEEIRRRREEDEKVEKMQLLYKLYEYEQRGHNMASSYSMESNVDELRFEVSKIRNIENAKHSVKWYKVFLMIVVSTVETLNTKFDPFGLRLKGWSKDMNTKKDDLDDCFHRLHDKYSLKAAIEPELELAFALFGGAFMYHLENAADSYGDVGTLVKAIAGGGPQPMKQQPPVMTNMHSFQPQVPTGQQQPQAPSMGQQYQQQPQPPTGQYYQQPQVPTGQQPQGQQYTQPQQPEMYQPQVPMGQEPERVGKTGRRIMRGPPIPSGASDIASMLPSMMDGPPDDVPIPTNFTVPPSVGGPRSKSKPPSTPSEAAPPKKSSRTPKSEGKTFRV